MTAATDPSPASVPAELPAELDNGAAGRNTFERADHVPPAAACADQVVASDRSLLVRVLPDGPRRPDGSLAFTAGLCVYLPPGYADAHRAYPVVYLLHGGGGDAADAVTFGGIRRTMDELAASDPSRAAIVVMPDGTDGQWYDSVDGTIRNETYLLDHVVPYVDARFRTVAARWGRAVVGISNGGFGAMLLAAKAPDRFAAAGGMSSNLDAETLAGLGPRRTAHARGNRPTELAANLRPVALTLDIATSCTSDDPLDLCEALAVDLYFLAANRRFLARVLDARRAGDAPVEYRETEGSHDWRWWGRWLRERQLPFVLDHLAAEARRRQAGPAPTSAPAPAPAPASFDHRSVASRFTVWGYTVAVDRRAPGFTALHDVRPEGFGLEGAGQVSVTTSARYQPGTPVSVTLTGDEGAPTTVPTVTTVTTVDADGRLTVTVDLGGGGHRTVALEGPDDRPDDGPDDRHGGPGAVPAG